MATEEWIDVSEAKDGGCLKKLLVPGVEGTKASRGEEVVCHYTGTLEDGSKFDSSKDRGRYFRFPLGVGRVIKGWDIGIGTMNVGEKCILKCRSDYAYGAAGHPPVIPQNATLNFEVERYANGTA